MAPCMKALGRAGFGRRRHASERIARTGQIKLAIKQSRIASWCFKAESA